MGWAYPMRWNANGQNVAVIKVKKSVNNVLMHAKKELSVIAQGLGLLTLCSDGGKAATASSFETCRNEALPVIAVVYRGRSCKPNLNHGNYLSDRLSSTCRFVSKRVCGKRKN